MRLPQFLLGLAAASVHPSQPSEPPAHLTSSWSFDSSGQSNQTLPNGRSFLVHRPDTYNESTPHPVVLSFHGYSRDEAVQEKKSGFSEDGLTIDGRPIIAVYPRGTVGPGKHGTPELAWQGAPYAKPGVDDVAFTHAILDVLASNLNVDTSRIYAAGKSNGGGFVNLLACTRSTARRIAAFSLVSAALYDSTHPFKRCHPGRIVPIQGFHGTEDEIIPYRGRWANKKGDPRYATPHLESFWAGWAGRNGLSVLPDNVTHPYKNTTKFHWGPQGRKRGIVEGFKIWGLGHSWPNTEGLDRGQKAPFNATEEEIVPFFEAYKLSQL